MSFDIFLQQIHNYTENMFPAIEKTFSMFPAMNFKNIKDDSSEKFADISAKLQSVLSYSNISVNITALLIF